MNIRTVVVVLCATVASLGAARADEDEKGEKPEDTGALMQALPKAKVTLALLEVTSKAAKEGGPVFSVTPAVHDRKPVFVVLVASKGKVQELAYDLMTGAETKPSKVPLGER